MEARAEETLPQHKVPSLMVDVTGQTRKEKVILPLYLQGKKPPTIPNKKVKIASFLSRFISSELSSIKPSPWSNTGRYFESVYWNMAVAIYLYLLAILEVSFLSNDGKNSFCVRHLHESSVSKRAELPPFSLRTPQWLNTSENSNQYKFSDSVQNAASVFTQIGMSFCNSSG